MINPYVNINRAREQIHGIESDVNYNAQTNIETNNPPEQEQGWLTRGLATIGNFVNNIVMGAVKSIEGIVDAGAMIGGLFGADVDDFVSYDITSDIFGTDEEGEGLLDWAWGRNLENVSYLDNDSIVNQIAEGVGGMLPTIGIAIATGGTSLAGSLGAKALQTGSFIAGAMGKSSEQALKEGATYEQALGYGALSGATEGVIESLSGGIGGTKMGTVLGKQIAKKTGTKLATTFIGEGLEEVASDLIDPVYKRITGVDKEAKVDTNNLFRTFVVGGSVGAILGGSGRILSARQNAENGGSKFLKVTDEITEIEDAIQEKESVLGSEKKTQEDVNKVSVKVADNVVNSINKISQQLQSMTESQRANALKIINQEQSIVSNLFEENGAVKPGVIEEVNASVNRNMTANTILKTQKVNERLASLNEQNKEKGWDLQIDDTQVTEEERGKMARFFATQKGIAEKSGKNLNFVVVKGEGAKDIDGFYSPNEKTIFITKETLNDYMEKTTTHEVEHFIDNDLLRKYLINSAKEEGGLLSETIDKVVAKKGYGLSKEDFNSAIYKKTIGQKLNEQEQLAYEELSAHLAEDLLGNADFIKRLARSNRGLFNKVKNFISDKLDSNPKSKRYITAEHIFNQALNEMKERGEELDNNNEIRYAKKGYAQRSIDQITQKDYQHHAWAFLNNVISESEWGVVNSAISDIKIKKKYPLLNNVYMIPTGEYKGFDTVYNKIVFTNGDFDNPSIIKVLEIDKNFERENKFIEWLFKEYENGLSTSKELFRVIENYSQQQGEMYCREFSIEDFGTLQEIKEQRRTFTEDNEYYQRKQNGTRSSREIRFIIEDSDGNTLSPEQREYFNKSKVLDEDGNLLVLYHGSKANENVFDEKHISSWNMFGKGYYFTTSERRAKSYAKESLKKVYVNLENPFFANKREHLNKIYKEINNTRKDIEQYSDEKGIGGREFFKICNYLDDIGVDISKILQGLGFDGIYYEGYEDVEIVAYRSNQIKLTTNKTPTESNDIRFSLKSTVEKDVTNKYGSTYNWRETGYILTDGTRLDLSGKREGATGGRRTVDHRDIFEEYEDIAGSDAMIEFMSRGNIRVSPEYPGINIQVEPNAEQYRLIQDLVERIGWKDEYFSVDFDNKFGDVVETLTYEGKVSGRKVVADIKYYFKEGKVPYQSELSKFRFSFKDSANYTLSEGQVKKKVANYTKLKVYSKKEAEGTINSILETNLNLEDYDVRISGKTKAEAIDTLWQALNTKDAGNRTGIASKIADYIIDNAVMENIYLEEENQIYTETVNVLKPYLHSVDLSGIREEIKNRYDTNNSVYLLWGKHKGKTGQTADQVAQELAENGFYIEAESEADIFFEMDEAYRKATRELKAKTESLLKQSLSEEELHKMKQDIIKDILRSYDSNGKKTKLAELIEEQKAKAKVWKDLYYEEKARNHAINGLLYQVEKIRDIHFGDFQNSTQYHNTMFRGSIEKLGRIKNRGDLNESGTRKIVAELSAWYTEDNPVLKDRFVNDISYILNDIALGNGKLTTEELSNLSLAVAYFRHFIETNNKIYRNGKLVDAKPLAEEYVQKIKDNQNIRVGAIGRFFDKALNNSKHSYLQTFGDPMTVARYMDKYDNGFFTKTIEELRESAVNASFLEMELNSKLEEFYKKNKKFLKDITKRTVNYNGVEIPVDKALYVYMALNREQALMGLARSGFVYENKKGVTFNVNGFNTDEDATLEDIKYQASVIQAELEKQFTETDMEYIKIAEKLFNEDCKKLKAERDKQRLGYTNVLEDYSIPIRRANISKNVDTSDMQFEIDRVSNLSFNKSIKKGAKNELFVESLDLVLTRHLRGIAQYYHLSNAIDNYNILYNMDVGGNPNKSTSVASTSKNTWKYGDDYMRELISDIQGIKKGEGSKAFGFIRSNYAKYQLGANPKVWFTQLSSFFASTSILDYKSVIKGITIKTDDVDKYCHIAQLRNNDNTAVMAQGLIDNVGKVGDVLMKPIGMMDRFVIKRLFGACQVQVAKDNGLKIGTEENKVKAGELLQKVILETQQNALATERSKAMRSSSELMRTLTMFTSDSMKVIGRVIDSYGELSVLKAKRKATTDASERARLDKMISKARKQAGRATASLVTQAMFMALIAQAFKTLYNKDEDEEEIPKNMLVDAVGNLFGGLPVFKDIYAKLVEGYDFDGYQYSAINDLLDSASNVVDLTGDIFSGNADSRDIANNIRKMSYSIGQIFGIPVRNVYNVIFGLTNRISPSTGYWINDKFYKQSYGADLKKAIEENDEKMISTIAGLMMNENIGDFGESSSRNEINRLVGAGYDVLPQNIPSSITIEDVQHTLTVSQKEQFREVYNQSVSAIDKLVSSNGYKIASDDVKSKAIKYVYRYYYYEAQGKTLNNEIDTKLYLFGQVIPIEKMALILAEIPTIAEKSKDKKKAVQSYLQATKLTATQKYILMGYFGYKNTNGTIAVKNAINQTSLSKEQKKLLLEKCGY